MRPAIIQICNIITSHEAMVGGVAYAMKSISGDYLHTF